MKIKVSKEKILELGHDKLCLYRVGEYLKTRYAYYYGIPVNNVDDHIPGYEEDRNQLESRMEDLEDAMEFLNLSQKEWIWVDEIDFRLFGRKWRFRINELESARREQHRSKEFIK